MSVYFYRYVGEFIAALLCGIIWALKRKKAKDDDNKE